MSFRRRGGHVDWAHVRPAVGIKRRRHRAGSFRTDMRSHPDDAVTEMLIRWQKGDRVALEQVVGLVYKELRRIARARLRGERANHTLETAALVNEAYLRLVQLDSMRFQSRTHFLAIASRVMRQVLVDHARRRRAGKRGDDGGQITVGELPDARATLNVDLLALDRALDDLAVLDAQQVRIIELRFFAGLTIDEAAGTLGVSTATVERDWAMAKAWLYKRLSA